MSTKVNYNKDYVPKNRIYNTCVKVLNKDVLGCAIMYSTPLVLNMANAYTPGGQFLQQKNNFYIGQEEYLFRETNLGELLDKKQYPIKTNEAILTKRVKINNKKVNINTPIFLDFISCPSVDMRGKQYGITLDKEIEEIMYMKIRCVFQTANINGYTNLILSAFGCGGFCLPPEAVSDIFNNVIEEYKGCFQNIVFAIKDYESHQKTNYNIFLSKINVGK